MKAFTLLSVLLVGACASSLPLTDLRLPKNVSASNVWALLVAGSNGYDNYRHQADVCHAYQILHAHGISDDHIVVMMYDDIADNDDNPEKGKIINKPDGPDVYGGVPKDYTKDDVTPTNFLKILRGDKAGMSGIGSGKVIESGPDDYVFVNMVDHGGVGIFAFPGFVMLHAKDLQNTLEKMHTKNQYKQMVIYMEACESGSMFENLPDNWNIYVTAAANAEESSYACYFDNKLGTYLGDVYSIKWMEDTDQNGTSTQTLEQQFEIVKQKTTTSHVSQYGQMTFDGDLLSVFMGSKSVAPQQPGKGCDDSTAVPSYDATIVALTKRIAECKCEKQKKILEIQLQKELQARQEVRAVVERVVVSVAGNEAGAMEKALGTTMKLTRHECRRLNINKFFERCPKVAYAVKLVGALSNLCEMGYPEDEIMHAINVACQ